MREVPQAAAPTPRAQATGRDRLSQRTTHAAEVARVRPPRAAVERRARAARLRLGPHRRPVARVPPRAPAGVPARARARLAAARARDADRGPLHGALPSRVAGL